MQSGEGGAVPTSSSGPSLGCALRDAGADFFYNSWRVVPLNVVWGIVFLVALAATIAIHPVAGLLVVTVTAIPLAGLARLGGQATRGLDVNFSDSWEPIRQRPRAVVLAGVGFTLAVTVFTLNLIAGFAVGNALGWAFATAAGWGIVTTIGLGFTFWPLLTDPERDTAPSREIARLAALLVVAHPFRIAALSAVLVVLLAASTVAFAALISVSVGYAMLAAARYVLPAADRLEARLVAIGRIPPLRVATDPDEGDE